MDWLWIVLAAVGILAFIALFIFVFYWVCEMLGAESVFEFIIVALLISYLPLLIVLVVLFPEQSRSAWQRVLNKQPTDKQ